MFRNRLLTRAVQYRGREGAAEHASRKRFKSRKCCKALMSSQTTQAYVFGRFRIDVGKRLLFVKDELVALTPKAFDTLLVLVENRGTVLSKEQLMRLVWADHIVEENNLAQNIHLIRKSLGEGSEGVKYIETIPKRGYRFVADVEVLTEPLPAPFAARPP